MRLMAALLAALAALGLPAAADDLPKPLTDADFRQYRSEQIKLGQLLFYDRVLSGTYRVSCGTCHNHDRASSNGARLDGREEKRDELAVGGEPVYEPFKPSSDHAPPLFNLGAKQFDGLFFDRRVARRADGSFASPAGDELPDGLQDVLAVQALFPAVNKAELVGTVDNDVAAVAHLGNRAIWDALAERVRGLEEYWPHFHAAYPQLESPSEITITHIANAIGAFVGTEWRADDAPFDRYLRGDRQALTKQQERGMRAFYGVAGCSQCHVGSLQTDHKLHRDTLANSRSLARTPSLRNVEKTGPWGNLGKLPDLPELVLQHMRSLSRIKRSLGTCLRKTVQPDGSTKLASGPCRPPSISVKEAGKPTMRDDLVAFLTALTDESGLRGRLGKPEEVPSSLVVD